MSQPMSAEDIELDARWRRRFGEPLPILGAHAIVKVILEMAEIPSPDRGRLSGGSNVVCLESRRRGSVGARMDGVGPDRP